MCGKNDIRINNQVTVNGKKLLNGRMQDADNLYSVKMWTNSFVDFYYTSHAWKNAKSRWDCSTKELFLDNCIEILDSDTVDNELLGVEHGQPIALLDESSGKIIWFRMQFNDKNKRIEIFLHSVFRLSENNYSYVYIQYEDTYCVKVLENGDVISGIENIPEFKLNSKIL